MKIWGEKIDLYSKEFNMILYMHKFQCLNYLDNHLNVELPLGFWHCCEGMIKTEETKFYSYFFVFVDLLNMVILVSNSLLIMKDLFILYFVCA